MIFYYFYIRHSFLPNTKNPILFASSLIYLSHRHYKCYHFNKNNESPIFQELSKYTVILIEPISWSSFFIILRISLPELLICFIVFVFDFCSFSFPPYSFIFDSFFNFDNSFIDKKILDFGFPLHIQFCNFSSFIIWSIYFKYCKACVTTNRVLPLRYFMINSFIIFFPIFTSRISFNKKYKTKLTKSKQNKVRKFTNQIHIIIKQI